MLTELHSTKLCFLNLFCIPTHQCHLNNMRTQISTRLHLLSFHVCLCVNKPGGYTPKTNTQAALWAKWRPVVNPLQRKAVVSSWLSAGILYQLCLPSSASMRFSLWQDVTAVLAGWRLSPTDTGGIPFEWLYRLSTCIQSQWHGLSWDMGVKLIATLCKADV